jgi:hypothetical protein
MSWSKAVYSSNVSEVGYDEETQELLVTWKSGRVSAYAGVPEEVAVELSNAPSVGTMMNSTIKPMYAHRYVR